MYRDNRTIWKFCLLYINLKVCMTNCIMVTDIGDHSLATSCSWAWSYFCTVSVPQFKFYLKKMENFQKVFITRNEIFLIFSWRKKCNKLYKHVHWLSTILPLSYCKVEKYGLQMPLFLFQWAQFSTQWAVNNKYIVIFCIKVDSTD